MGNTILISITVSEIWDHCQNLLDDPGIYSKFRVVGIGGEGARGPCPPNNLHKYAPPPPPKKKKKNIYFFFKINLWITPVIFTSMPLKISTIVPYYGFHICALEQFNICAPNVPPPFHFHSCDPYCFHICALDTFHRCHPPSIIFTSVPPPPS